MTQSPFVPNVRPVWPEQPTRGIGIIGAGGIVEWGHLPAYRAAGFNVAGLTSRTAASVEALAAKWKVERTFPDWRALIEAPEVEIVDVTYPLDEDRLLIVEHAARCGKHILMQKPLAHSMDAAQHMVDLAKKHNVLLAVNHNARWCPQYRAAQQAIREGWLGDPYLITHHLQSNQDSQGWFTDKWYAQQERFQILEYMIHHLDLTRFWTGEEPTKVRATIGRKPTQVSRGEMLASVQLEFASGLLAVLIDNNASHQHNPASARFLIEGTTGMIEGNSLPPANFHLRSDRYAEGIETQSLELPGAWFPDGFAGTMGELLCAIDEKRQPSISGEDNLKTLKLVFEAYEDAQ